MVGCVYSTVHDGGVRLQATILSERRRLGYHPIQFTNGEDILLHFAETKDHPYGWRDLAQSQLFGTATADDRGDFCSEWCAAAIGLPNAATYSPQRLGR